MSGWYKELPDGAVVLCDAGQVDWGWEGGRQPARRTPDGLTVSTPCTTDSRGLTLAKPEVSVKDRRSSFHEGLDVHLSPRMVREAAISSPRTAPHPRLSPLGGPMRGAFSEARKSNQLSFDADVEAIVTLTEQIREIRLEVGKPRGRIGRIHPSVNPFVPKPGTPFQWLRMESVKETDDKLQYLRKAFARIPNVEAICKSARTGFYQTILALGDRRVGDALEYAVLNECDLKRATKAAGLDPAFAERLAFAVTDGRRAC